MAVPDADEEHDTVQEVCEVIRVVSQTSGTELWVMVWRHPHGAIRNLNWRALR
jgi:hypothetical protein